MFIRSCELVFAPALQRLLQAYNSWSWNRLAAKVDSCSEVQWTSPWWAECFGIWGGQEEGGVEAVARAIRTKPSAAPDDEWNERRDYIRSFDSSLNGFSEATLDSKIRAFCPLQGQQWLGIPMEFHHVLNFKHPTTKYRGWKRSSLIEVEMIWAFKGLQPVPPTLWTEWKVGDSKCKL